MQAIRRKLNSQRGASMLMALLLMLVGIMVSAVIISAATSAAVNKRSEKEQQQAYLAVSSAAELVRDDFQSLTGRYKDVTTTVTQADGTTTTTNDTIKATCAVGDMINDIGARFIGMNTTSTYAKTYTFSVDGMKMYRQKSLYQSAPAVTQAARCITSLQHSQTVWIPNTPAAWC